MDKIIKHLKQEGFKVVLRDSNSFYYQKKLGDPVGVLIFEGDRYSVGVIYYQLEAPRECINFYRSNFAFRYDKESLDKLKKDLIDNLDLVKNHKWLRSEGATLDSKSGEINLKIMIGRVLPLTKEQLKQ
jgi:hypothetical protein